MFPELPLAQRLDCSHEDLLSDIVARFTVPGACCRYHQYTATVSIDQLLFGRAISFEDALGERQCGFVRPGRDCRLPLHLLSPSGPHLQVLGFVTIRAALGGRSLLGCAAASILCPSLLVHLSLTS